MKDNINNSEPNIYQSKENFTSKEKTKNQNKENKKYDETEFENQGQNDNNEDNTNNEIDEENEKLIKILSDINDKLSDKKNKNKKIETIYESYNHKDEDKREIKNNISYCFIYFMYLVFAGIFVIINLMGIYTIRAIMTSLYEIFINSIQYYLWKKSDLEKNELTDFESIYNSSYNFYEQFFEDLSNNEVDFDLMMFWDFFGSLLYDYLGFSGTSILFLILNIALIAFIGGFEFLDIDEKTHKYSFFQVLYVTLVYFFLWICVGASALLSQQFYIDAFKVLAKKKDKEEKEKVKKEQEDQEKEKKNKEKVKENNIQKDDSKIKSSDRHQIVGGNSNHQKNSNELNNEQIIVNENNNDQKKAKEEEREKENKFDFFFMIYFTSFTAFLINYIINRAILKYRNKYVSKELENNNNKEEAYINIHLKDEHLFLYCICIPCVGEIIISLIMQWIFNCCIFADNNNEENNNEQINVQIIEGKEEKNKETNEIIQKKENNEQSIIKKGEEKKEIKKDILKIKKVSFKKICGYMIFNQTIVNPKIIKEEEPRCRNYCFFKCFSKCCGFCNDIANCCDYFCECLTLLLIALRDCIKETFCFFCNKIFTCNCCNCKCCFGFSCCCCDDNSFEQKEIDFCLCYQQKRKVEWFREYINNETQKSLIRVVFLMAFLETFIIGLEDVYNEKNEKEHNKENMTLPLLYSFLFYIWFPLIFYFSYLPTLRWINEKPNKKQFHESSNSGIGDIFNGLAKSILYGNVFFISFVNSISSFYFSILYFKNRNSFFNKKELCLPVYFHKFTIFMLSFFCQTKDEDLELLSNSSLISVYLYILDLAILLTKKILPLTGLIIIQIIFSSLVVLVDAYFLLIFLCLMIKECCYFIG